MARMEDNLKLNEEKNEIQKLTDVLPTAISLFNGLSEDNRQKLFQSLATIFDLHTAFVRAVSAPSPLVPTSSGQPGHFSEDRSISPKDFILQKQPRTDVERVACLAYYLTHYRDTPYFKTLDVSKLNTDAAQMKFSNAAKSVDNATMLGYLVPATKGNKQLSAAGELFVRALPDREAAKAAMSNSRPRRKQKKGALKEPPEDGNLSERD